MKSRYHLLLLMLVIIIFFTVYFASEDFRRLVFRGTQIDSIGHVFSFFALTWILHNMIKLRLLIITFTLVFYGALTELGQSFLGFRSGELNDFLFNLLGISLYCLLYWIFKYFKINAEDVK